MCGKPDSEAGQPDCGNTQKPPRSPPLHAAGHPHPPGRDVQNSPSGRHGHLRPGTPRFARGLYDPGVSGTPASRLPSPLFFPAGRLGRGGPQPKPGREDGAGEFLRRQPRWGKARGTVGGRGPVGRPRATHASNLLFILSQPPSPLPHGVTSAPPGRPSSLGPGYFRLRRAQRNVCALARCGAGMPGRPPWAAARRRRGPAAVRVAALGANRVPVARPRGRPDPLPRRLGERGRAASLTLRALDSLLGPNPDSTPRAGCTILDSLLTSPRLFPLGYRPPCFIVPASSGCRVDRTGSSVSGARHSRPQYM